MSNPNLTYSGVEVAWYLATWADDGQDNGLQTISIDNINLTNVSVVPEPSALWFSCGARLLAGIMPSGGGGSSVAIKCL